MNDILKVCKCKDIVWIEPPCSIAKQTRAQTKDQVECCKCLKCPKHMISTTNAILLAMLHCPTWRCVASPVGYEPHLYTTYDRCAADKWGAQESQGLVSMRPNVFVFWSNAFDMLSPLILGNLQKRVRRNPTTWLQGAPRSKSCSRIFSDEFSPAILRPKTAWRICRVSSTSSPSDIIASFFELWAKYRLLPQSPMATGDGSSCTLWLFHIAMENGP